jgi:hypothetical protein
VVACLQIIHSEWFAGKILQINDLHGFLLSALFDPLFNCSELEGWFAPSILGWEGCVFVGDFALLGLWGA